MVVGGDTCRPGTLGYVSQKNNKIEPNISHNLAIVRRIQICIK